MYGRLESPPPLRRRLYLNVWPWYQTTAKLAKNPLVGCYGIHGVVVKRALPPSMRARGRQRVPFSLERHGVMLLSLETEGVKGRFGTVTSRPRIASTGSCTCR